MRRYPQENVEAGRRILLELARLFRSIGREFIVVGGWAAHLLVTECPRDGHQTGHHGTLDIDLMLSVVDLTPSDFRQIRDLLLQHQYKPSRSERRPFAFCRMAGDGHKIPILVDFMAPREWDKNTGSVFNREDIWFMPLDAGRLVREFNRQVQLTIDNGDGTQESETVLVADFPALMAMKGPALADRLGKANAPEGESPGEEVFDDRAEFQRGKHEKHAYDIACVVQACSPRTVAESIIHARQHVAGRDGDELERGLNCVWQHFSRIDASGPEAAAIARAQGDSERIPQYTNDAFFAMADFLERLGFEVTRPLPPPDHPLWRA